VADAFAFDNWSRRIADIASPRQHDRGRRDHDEYARALAIACLEAERDAGAPGPPPALALLSTAALVRGSRSCSAQVLLVRAGLDFAIGRGRVGT
jgi:hypothetical protein